MKKVDDFELLRTFCAVNRYGRLKAAGESLGILSSTVLRRLRQLESLTGKSLCVRNEKGCFLTSEGTDFLRQAEEILKEYDEAADQLIHRKVQKPRLYVSCPYSFATFLLIPWVEEFRRQHPGIEIDLDLTLGPVKTLSALCDIRLSHGFYPSERVFIRHLGFIDRVMCASKTYLEEFGTPKTPKDLERHNLIGGQDLAAHSNILLQRGEEFVRIPFNPAVIVKSHHASLKCAFANVGIAVHLFKYDAQKYIDDGSLLQVLPEWQPESCPVSMLFPENRKPSELTQAFANFIEDKWNRHPLLHPADWRRNVLEGI